MISEHPMSSHPRLAQALRTNATLWEALGRLAALELPDWYLGAGCVAQTVWNAVLGNPSELGIRDYDLVYFDPNLSEGREGRIRDEAIAALGDLDVVLDVKNQARVHTWYRDRFGYDVRPYESIHDAIGSWPTTAGAVAVRPFGDTLEVCAPFGLDDLFGLVVRANRVQITPRIYEQKVRQWLARWPSLRVLPWERGVGEESARVLGSDRTSRRRS